MDDYKNELILKSAQNCLGVSFFEGHAHFRRFTDKQYILYNKNEAYEVRSKCPSGVCLKFETNSEYIIIKYGMDKEVRNWAYFDVYLNDTFVHTENVFRKPYTHGEFKYNIPHTGLKFNQITIYLPHLVQIFITDIEFSQACIIYPGKKYEKNLLCMGDSITFGANSFSPSVTYPVQLSRFFGMNVLNQGIGGYIFDENSIDENMKFKPDYITVAYGTNDMHQLKSKEEFINNCKSFFEKISVTYPLADIYAIIPIWRDSYKNDSIPGGIETLQDVFLQSTRSLGRVKLINGIKFVPNISSFFVDGLHPNDTGFMHYSLNLIKEIIKLQNENHSV